MTLERIERKDRKQVYENFVKQIHEFEKACIYSKGDAHWFYIMSNDEPVGIIACRKEKKEEGYAGYLHIVIKPEYRGRGFVKSELLLFDHMPELTYLVAITRKWNKASQIAHERIGFQFHSYRDTNKIYRYYQK